MWRGAAWALATAATGALVAGLLGLPAAVLVGATLAVTALALTGPSLGLPAPTVPSPLRDVAFAIIGMTLGAGITPNILADIARWPSSLAAMLAALVVSTFAAAFVLRRFFRVDRQTALLATSPGALSYAVALALEGKADARTVVVLQGVRLFAITVFVPPLVVGLGGAVPIEDAPASALAESLVMLLLACIAGIALSRLRLPAAWLIAGLLISGAAHWTGLVEGRPWPPLLVAGFVVAGAVIGARFAGFTRAELRHLAVEGAVVSAIAIALSALFSALAAVWFDLAFGQVWVAYAPGGVEGMAAVALSLGYDPVFVATHHIVRLCVLILLLPILVSRLDRSARG